jgi:hypothetical protein
MTTFHPGMAATATFNAPIQSALPKEAFQAEVEGAERAVSQFKQEEVMPLFGLNRAGAGCSALLLQVWQYLHLVHGSTRLRTKGLQTRRSLFRYVLYLTLLFKLTYKIRCGNSQGCSPCVVRHRVITRNTMNCLNRNRR